MTKKLQVVRAVLLGLWLASRIAHGSEAPPTAPVVLSNRVLEVSVDPHTGSLALVDRRVDRSYRLEPPRSVEFIGATRLGDNSARMELRSRQAGGPFEAILRLAESKAELTIDISTKASSMAGDLYFPGPAAVEKGQWLVVPMNEGILYPVDDQTIKAPGRLSAYAGHGGLSMPWFGVTDMNRGLMAIIETADDSSALVSANAAGLLTIAPIWEPCKGKLGYPRRIRYLVLDQGGYVAQAKAYRRYVSDSGRFKSLKEKLAENPLVDLLVGAPDVWTSGVDPLAVAKGLRAAGVERLLFCYHGGDRPEMRAKEVEAIHSLGYLATRYDSYRSAWPVGEPPQARRHFDNPDRIVKQRDGALRPAWVIKTPQRSYPGYELTSSEQVKEALETIPADSKANGYQGRFIDTTTAAGLMEDYDPKHPLTRSDDKQNKIRLLEIVSKDCGLISGSETGQDWAAPAVHYFEGMMSLARYRLPDSGRNMYGYTPPTEELLKYQLGPKYRLPLWELVYHDAVVAVWYWGDGSNKLPELWDLRDRWNILYGTPPLWMIDQQKWETQRERFARCYRQVCPVVRAVGYQEMLSHEFLAPDHTVQRSRFANGVLITVNFGEKPFSTAEGETLAPLGYSVSK